MVLVSSIRTTQVKALANALAIALAVGCGSSHAKGRIIVAVTVDWEGAYFSPEGLDALDDMRKALGDAPITHFVSAAYFTKEHPDPRAGVTIAEAVHKGDELAVHLHAWKSLAIASGIEAKLSPSFLSGTDKLLAFDDGDVGFDTDLDAYSAIDLRAMLRTSRHLLEQTHVTVSNSFRAGGYLGTPKVLEAIREEGFTVDSSATDFHQLEVKAAGSGGRQPYLPKRVAEVWPSVDPMTPSFLDPRGQVIEMPIGANADYVTVPEIVSLFQAAHARLQKRPERDVFVVVGFNQETAVDFAKNLRDAMLTIKQQPQLAGELSFTTMEKAAALARSFAETPK